MLQDSTQRALATDPARSFIVQAPAGSGKTEILTQRYLRLLGTVSAPEQIVALTFTRKAASEMRERILVALRNSASGVEATSAHQQQTLLFAAKALQRSEQENWHLLNQPGRLRIITLDSFCQMVNQAIPLVEKQIPFAKITDTPTDHYLAAARAFFAYALQSPLLQKELTLLLEHLDNRQESLLDLFCDLLAEREQWLTPFYQAREQEKGHYEKMLARIEHHELARLKQTIAPEFREALCSLSRQVATIEANPATARSALMQWQDFEALDKQIASGLAALLLTSENKLRKSFDHHVGLQRDKVDAECYNRLKEGSKSLLANLELVPDFVEALIKVKHLPEPRYDALQWQVLQSLFTLLPFLVAHLQLIFSEHNEVDFSAVSSQALAALGTDEQPTDLTLYLDNAIHHFLIDEFQDTSIQQFHLLTRLVQGWQSGDGRTLFVVGDPMQSIYRFRQAEVGLFLKAKQQGIGPVALTNLELCCNFRSSEPIVQWVNQQFKAIFPNHDDIALGAISFHSSVAVKGMDSLSTVEAFQFPTRAGEAAAIVKQVKKELLENPQDTIAILARQRNQLRDILQELRKQQVPFQGVDIERLSALPHLRDIWSLTEALLNPANRLAWLCLLRSPLCGLSLEDLHAIANFAPKKSIVHALSHLSSLTLSEEGRLRAAFIYATLSEALAARHQDRLIDWLVRALNQLHGPILLNENEQADVEQFWLLLERISPSGELPDLTRLKSEFDKLYSQRTTPSRLQIMTIHKSKGLEFDCVILPALSAKSRNKSNPLLRWLKLPQEGKELMLVSPMKAAHREPCLLYNYLSQLDAEKDRFELQRLFYVATTRAKKRLYLFDYSEKESKGSFRSFLKNTDFFTEEAPASDDKREATVPVLTRLPVAFYANPTQNTHPVSQRVSFLATTTARQTGIIAHELLQWVCDKHPNRVVDLPWNLVKNRFRKLGFSVNECQEACQALESQMEALFANPVGQWICEAHQEERNEYELLVTQDENQGTRIIDRTFIDKGKRWVIDFKTGNETEETVLKHRQQVNEYARLLSYYSLEPVYCGLYYLATGKWVAWDYQLIESEA
ncbi:MAG: UvrD-helicase domain-containing protein [Tatlockia sp.]|jgi:ATP-dependent exoDNAse (exonuclease V) beta subunit